MHKYILSISLILSYTIQGFATNLINNSQPIYFHSNKMIYQLHSRQITYLGQVHIDQGSTHIIGDKVIVHPQQQNGIAKLHIYGNPAQYCTLPQGKHTVVSAVAKQIDYDVQHDLVTLTGQAKIKQPPNSLASNKIWYDIKLNQARTPRASGSQRTVIKLGAQGK